MPADPGEHYSVDVAQTLRRELRERGQAAARALALPEDPADGRTLSRPAFLARGRAESYRDPTHFAVMRDRLSPVAVTLPDGTKLRSETGEKNFHDYVRATRPDIWLQAMSAPPPPPPGSASARAGVPQAFATPPMDAPQPPMGAAPPAPNGVPQQPPLVPMGAPLPAPPAAPTPPPGGVGPQ